MRPFKSMNVLEGWLASAVMVNVRPRWVGSPEGRRRAEVTLTLGPRWGDHRWDDGPKRFATEPQGRSGLLRRMTGFHPTRLFTPPTQEVRFRRGRRRSAAIGG